MRDWASVVLLPGPGNKNKHRRGDRGSLLLSTQNRVWPWWHSKGHWRGGQHWGPWKIHTESVPLVVAMAIGRPEQKTVKGLVLSMQYTWGGGSEPKNHWKDSVRSCDPENCREHLWVLTGMPGRSLSTDSSVSTLLKAYGPWIMKEKFTAPGCWAFSWPLPLLRHTRFVTKSGHWTPKPSQRNQKASHICQTTLEVDPGFACLCSRFPVFSFGAPEGKRLWWFSAGPAHTCLCLSEGQVFEDLCIHCLFSLFPKQYLHNFILCPLSALSLEILPVVFTIHCGLPPLLP